jgi:DNA (cytosine-5)-methyltransferase 1
VSGADLLTAGFPCQDLSQAGNTAGISGERSSLVGHVLRLLEVEPIPWVLIENVPFMLRLGKGIALHYIVDALERLGYKWAYRIVDSRAFGLPQRRQRVFLLACREGDPAAVLLSEDAGEPPRNGNGLNEVACGFYWTEGIRGLGWATDAVPTLKGGSTVGIPSPPAIVFPGGDIHKPDIRDAERLQGFPADWTMPAERVAKGGYRWKLDGNAVSVDVSEWIGSRLLDPFEFRPVRARPMKPFEAWPVAAWNNGDGRRTLELSMWPLHRKRVPLAQFLQYPTTPLSSKATAGFLSRLRLGYLNLPDGFEASVEAHLHRMLAFTSSAATV